MANPIDLIVTQEAIKGVDALIAKVTIAREGLLSLGQQALDSSKSVSKISTPSGLNNNTTANAQINAEIKKQTAEIEKSHAVIAKAAEQSRLAEIRLQQAREKSFDSFERNSRKETALAEKNANAYNKTQAQINRLTVAYNDLSLRKQRYNNLSANEEMRLQTLSRVTEKYNGILKQTDAQIGKNQRNVGNYASGYNSLGNSISQLTSAIGITTGIAGVVALGRNIFNTTKEIISMDNALKLVTETQENYVLQQAFLTKISEDFGAEIGSLTKQFTQFYVSAKDKISSEEIQGIFRSVTKAGAAMGLSLESQQRAFLALNQMMSKGTIQAEELRGQLGEALPGALGIMSKAVGVNEAELAKMMKAGKLIASEVLPKFAKQLEITYGIENVKRIDNLSSAQTRLSNSWTNFVRSLDEDGNTLSKFFTKILGTMSEIVKGTTLIFQSEAKKQQNTFKHLREKGYNETLQYYNSLDELSKKDLESNRRYLIDKVLDGDKEINAIRGRNLVLKALQRETPLGTVETSGNKAERLANEQKIKDLYNVKSSYVGQVSAINSLLEPQKKQVAINVEGNEAKKEKIKLTKLESVNTLELSRAEDTALEKLKMLKKALEQTRDETSKNSTEFKEFETTIKAVNESIDFITKGIQPIKLDIETPFVETTESVEKLKEVTDQWLNSFSSEFMSNSGFSETFQLLNGEIEGFGENFAVTFNAIAESAQEAFNFISNASQKNFDKERQRIEDQQAIAIGYAGGSATAINKINEDAEKRKKEIANRENKAKQKMALFNIGIDMAQGIVSALASTPPNIPLSIAIGAIGLAQIGFVASQKIPQYFDGTDNHSGGLMLVNDGKGANYQEKVILPNGKEITPQGRNVLMNAPAGTKVLTHEQQLFEMMQSNGINMTANYNKSNGMTANQMDAVLGKHFSNIKTHNTTFDKNGFKSYIQNGNSRTIMNQNRVSGSGISV